MTGEPMTDTEILDWINTNPNIRFQYNEKNQFFGPHWRVIFGPKSAENRHPDFRSVVRYAKELVQQQEDECSTKMVLDAVSDPDKKNDIDVWRQIVNHLVQ